ncbi:MAG: hypothetical protein D3915_15880 [Candidatus Electrothrix sp. AU1_5]|nr:hypothetical protein [Candidatus Electrothrix gigas]
MSTPSLQSSLIRIWSKELPDKKPFIAGAGFIITSEHALTCAHVINSALGRKEDDRRCPGTDERISLDFLGSDAPRAEARVLRWFPVCEDFESDELEDIAVLEFIGPLPAEVYPVSLVVPDNNDSIKIKMCGFPYCFSGGTYVEGIVQGAIKGGKIEVHPTKENRTVDPGFSGTAAWDMEQHVVCGMIVSRQIRTGGIHNVYMIPAEKLIKVLSDMNKHIFSNGHALIIGVQTYLSPLGDLPCTLEDAKGLAGILKDEGRCAYPEEQVLLLKDSEADRNGILAALDTLAKVTDTDSTVVIYFSGHGGKKDGGYYFCPYGFNPADLQETAISGPKFKKKIAAIPAKKKLILLDCCHAGGIGSGVKGEGFTKAAVPPEAIELFQQGKGCVFIASSAEDEFSYIGKHYSVFTGALIEAFSGKGVSRKDGYVRATDLVRYTKERVPRLTEDKQHPQHPDLDFEEADNFVLAYYAGGEKEAKEVSFVLQVDVSEENGMTDQKEAQEVENIRCHFIAARHLEAYQALSDLCRNNEKFNEFSAAADDILSRYNEIEQDIIFGRLTLAEAKIQKEQIKISYQTLMKNIICRLESKKQNNLSKSSR